MSKGKLKGKQIENQSINLSANSTPLNIDSYTVSSASFSNSGKQIINKEYTDSELELKLDRTQLDDGSSSTSSIWSSNKIESMFSGLTFSTVSIDDINIATYSVWSSDKTKIELDKKVDNIQIKGNGATGMSDMWSGYYLGNKFNEVGLTISNIESDINIIQGTISTIEGDIIDLGNDKLDRTQLDDGASSTSSIWSSDKVESLITSLTFSTVSIDDINTTTYSVWSSTKIDNELDKKIDNTQINNNITSTDIWSGLYLDSKFISFGASVSNIEGDINIIHGTVSIIESDLDNKLDRTQIDNTIGATAIWSGSYLDDRFLDIGLTLSSIEIEIFNLENNKLDKTQLDDGVSSTSSMWSSDKVESMINSLTFSTVEIDDNVTATNSVWSSIKTDNELGTKINENRIDNTNDSDKLWDGDFLNNKFIIVGSSFSTIQGSVSIIEGNIIDLDNNKVDKSQINNGITSTDLWSGLTIQNKFDSLTFSTLSIVDGVDSATVAWSGNYLKGKFVGIGSSISTIENTLDNKLNKVQLNDTIISTNSMWSSTKINTELDTKLDDSQINNNITATDLWSGIYLDGKFNNFGASVSTIESDINTIHGTMSVIEGDIIDLGNDKLDRTQLDDGASSTSSIWSSDKVDSLITSLTFSTVSINDINTTTYSVWSSSKIDNELDDKVDDNQINNNITSTDLWSGVYLDGKFTGFGASVSTIESDINTIHGTISTIGGDINIIHGSVSIIEGDVTNLQNNKLDKTQLNDGASNVNRIWSSDKVESMFSGLTFSTVSIDDINTTTYSVWSSTKIDNELDKKIDNTQINNNTTVTDLWSGLYLDNKFNGLGASVSTIESDINTIHGTISIIEGDIIDLGNDKLDKTQLDDGASSTVSIWSSNKVESMFSGLTFSTVSIDDINTTTYSVWSSSKIDNELSSKVDNTQINNNITATDIWSGLYLDSKFNNFGASVSTIEGNIIDLDNDKLDRTQLNDGASNVNRIWSSTKVENLINSLTFSTVSIDDINTTTYSVWSSTKIDNELDNKVDDSQINNNITTTDLWSGQYLEGKFTNFGASVSIIEGDINTIQGTISTIEGDIINLDNDKLDRTQLDDGASNVNRIWSSNKVENLINSLTFSTVSIDDISTTTYSVWSSTKIDNALDNKVDDSQINNNITTTDLWSGQYLDSMFTGFGASVSNIEADINTIQGTMSVIEGDIIDLDNDKLDKVQLNDGASNVNRIWSSDKVESLINSLTFSTVEIDDNSTALDKAWSSYKINSELSTKVDDNQINNLNTSTDLWSGQYLNTKFTNFGSTISIIEGDINTIQGTISTIEDDIIDLDDNKLDRTQLNDGVSSTSSMWSSDKINTELDTKLDDTQLNDSVTVSTSMWSSDKISSELDLKMTNGLSFSYMFMGNTANRVEPIKPFELYHDNIGDIALNENYLLNNYATVSIGQKIESIQQLSERVQQGWSTYNKNPNKEVIIDLDLSDTSFFSGGVLYINDYLNLDVINFINVPGSSASIETIIGFYEDFKTSFEVENGSIVKFIYNDVETATSNQIVTLNTSDYTIVGGTYSNRFSVYNDGNLNHQIEDNIYSVKDVSDGSYTVVLNNRNNNEYFGLSSSTTTVTLPNAINNGKTITFKDEAGNAGNSNVTISGSIDGSSSIILNTNYGSIKLLWNNNNWWKV